MEFPLATIEKMLERSRMRVSKEAVKEFNLLMEEIVTDLISEADTIAKAGGRKTVSGYDVRLAKRRIL